VLNKTLINVLKKYRTRERAGRPLAHEGKVKNKRNYFVGEGWGEGLKSGPAFAVIALIFKKFVR
jgi:hypothetical protein